MNSENPVNPTAAGGELGTGRPLTAQLWQQVKQRFAAALQLEPPARQAYLDREFAGDLVLRAEVESLLAFAEAGAVSEQSRPAERAVLAAGSRLGDYEIVSLLGPGGFGGAYRARDLRLHRDVAIKVLPEALSADAAALHRFEREAMAAARLNHPNIVTIHSIEHGGAVHLIVMELVEGQTLDRIIPEGGLPLEKFLDLAAELSDAVAAAHGKGIIHRDLKPGNIMVDNRGRIKILDFGIAKMTELAAPEASELQETEPGMVMGTFPYMSPEQLEGKKLDSRTDIFSLGAVLYQMATGERPVRGNTHAELISAILRDKPKSLMDLRADLPLSLQRVLERCLAKKVEERYTAPELHDAIEQLRQKNPSRRHAASSASAEGPHVRSLAVLPLENLSRDPEQEYFAEGMTESLITSLAKISALRVISRTTAMLYKQTDKSLPQIARELNVDAVVEGTVQRSGEQVCVSAQLIQASTDTHLWAGSYARDLRDVLALQSEVARAIAKEVQVRLTPKEQVQLARSSQVDPKAYEAYLKGRYHWNKRDLEGLTKGAEYFQEATENDPTYAAAYAGLADSASRLGFWADVAPAEGCARGKAAALKAIEMDNTLSEAYAALCYASIHYDFDVRAAEEAARRADELDPCNAFAVQGRACCLTVSGRAEEAAAEGLRAVQLEPLSLILQWTAGMFLYCARQYDEAIALSRKTLELDPKFAPSHYALGMAFVQKRMYGQAVGEMEVANQISQRGVFYLGFLGSVYGAVGRKEDAFKIINELRELSKQRHVSPFWAGLIYAALCEKDQAFLWLERALEDHAPWMAYLKAPPWFDNLRSDPRYYRLLQRMNIPI